MSADGRWQMGFNSAFKGLSVRLVTDDDIIWRMRVACQIAKATDTQDM